MTSYSSEIREVMVNKLCQPNGPSPYQLAKETGISVGSLYKWRHKAGGVKEMSKDRRPEDWSPEERLEAVFMAQGLSEHDYGEFLRSKGLYSHHIDEWKLGIQATFKTIKKKAGRPKKDPELAAAQKKLKILERDLLRKDRALAEQSAVIILQKKVDELWAEEEE